MILDLYMMCVWELAPTGYDSTHVKTPCQHSLVLSFEISITFGIISLFLMDSAHDGTRNLMGSFHSKFSPLSTTNWFPDSQLLFTTLSLKLLVNPLPIADFVQTTVLNFFLEDFDVVCVCVVGTTFVRPCFARFLYILGRVEFPSTTVLYIYQFVNSNCHIKISTFRIIL